MTPGTVAVVGAGNMGGGMAHRLLDLGWQVRVRDLLPARAAPLAQRGALACGDAASAAQGVQALIVCVVDAVQCEDVLFGRGGAVPALAGGTPVLLCPTIGPADAEGLAARLQAIGLAPVDAPISGGPQRARDGTMSLMVACPDATFDRVQPLLAALGDKVFHVGHRCGDGARTKLVNNLLAAINLAGAAEVLALAQRLGLDPAQTLDVIAQSSGQSWIGSDRMRRAIAGDFAPRAHMTLLRKDTALAVQAAEAAGFAGRLGPLAAQVFDEAVHAGMAELDDGALLRLFGGSHKGTEASS